jgi:hypothetical protein
MELTACGGPDELVTISDSTENAKRKQPESVIMMPLSLPSKGGMQATTVPQAAVGCVLRVMEWSQRGPGGGGGGPHAGQALSGLQCSMWSWRGKG